VTVLPMRYWSWRDVDADACWRQCCQVMLATALPSPTSDGATDVTLVMAQCKCQVMLAIALQR
jgi:hypothetical protein